MAAITLYIDTTDGVLLAGQVGPQLINPLTLPFFYGDTLTVNIWLYQRLAAASGQTPFPFSLLFNAGLAIQLAIYNGTVAGLLAPYAACVNFVPDPTNSYVTGQLSLNTAALEALIGTGTSANAFLCIGYFLNGFTTTVFKGQVNVGVGIVNGPIAIPPQLTPLSEQAAALQFLSIQPVPGQPYYLASASGRVIAITAVDDPNGGVHVDFTPTGQTI